MFSIPEGYCLKAGSHAIHSDSWLHGNYAVSLNIGFVDVVSMRTEKDDELLQIKPVKQTIPFGLSQFAPPKFPGLLMKYGATSTSSIEEVADCIKHICTEIGMEYAKEQINRYSHWFRCHKGPSDTSAILQNALQELSGSFKETFDMS